MLRPMTFRNVFPGPTRVMALAAIVVLTGGMLYAQVASTGEYDYVPGEVLVKFKDGTPGAKIASLNHAIGGQVLGTFPGDPGLYQVKVPEALGAGSAVSFYNNDDAVEYAELNIVYYTSAVPNDTRYSQQYALARIQAPVAWDYHVGDYSVVLADTDTGMDLTHPDLAQNLWYNPFEVCGDGLDNDGNGYVDDCYGWNFFNNNNNPSDTNGHGTHTAGTMAAVGNNGLGVAGVMWYAQIMPLKIGPGPTISSTAGINAIDYAWRNGAWAINASWGGLGFSQSLKNAVDRAGAVGVMVVAAAGNSGTNNDTRPYYPASYNSPNVIAVAATTSADARWTSSNYGANSVHLGAPGTGVLSTYRAGTYASLSGTSMAAPHVTAAVGLIWNYNWALTYLDVKSIIMSTVDPLPTLQGRTQTGGRLNLGRALQNTPPLAGAAQ